MSSNEELVGKLVADYLVNHLKVKLTKVLTRKLYWDGALPPTKDSKTLKEIVELYTSDDKQSAPTASGDKKSTGP